MLHERDSISDPSKIPKIEPKIEPKITGNVGQVLRLLRVSGLLALLGFLVLQDFFFPRTVKNVDLKCFV